jgi:exoribonuclease II
MDSGKIVEFIDSQKIVCAVVLENKNMRLRLLTENNREVKLSAGRLSHSGNRTLDVSSKREKLVAQLKEIAAHRRSLSEEIDIRTLWEVLHEEQTWIDLPTMAGLCFAAAVDGDYESAVMRAFFNDRLYFKFSAEGFWPQPADKVEEISARRAAEAARQNLLDQGGQWFQKVLKGQPAAMPSEGRTIIDILASYFLLEKESPHRDTAREILKKAGTGSPNAIFGFMVKIGVWHPDENLDLLRNGIPVDISDAVTARAETVCAQTAMPEGRRDLRHLAAITIDGPGTLDFDDALSIAIEQDHVLVGIHITDVGHYIRREDPVDLDARNRVSSIYMPDQKIPMLPPCLSEQVCSLQAETTRPAMSTLVRMTRQAEVIDFEIVPSLIRVQRQLTYPQADEMADSDPELLTLLSIARHYRSRRLDNGALMIELPEIAIGISPEGNPVVTRIDRESPGRLLVSELMILANELAARQLAAHSMPAIFRSQPEPRERLYKRDQGTLFQNWMQRKAISRFVLGSQPEPHAGLGLPAYVTGTSPIRKYTDLITQRQLRAILGLEPAYTQNEIQALIAALEETMGLVARTQHRRQRYWLLKHLEDQIGRKEQGIYLGRQRRGQIVLLPAYMLECPLTGADNINLKPEDQFQVTMQHVSARNDVISVCWG